MRIGIFGGAFDPVHRKHVKICESVLNEFNLDKLIVIPSYRPPHKRIEGGDNFSLRLEALKKAFADKPCIEISSMEYAEKKHNYSYEIVQKIHESYPTDELYFILGGDSLDKFSTWKYPEKITALATLIAVARPRYNTEDAAKKLKNEFGARVLISLSEDDDVSSSYIRALLELNDPEYIDYIPMTAAEIISGGYTRYGDITAFAEAQMSQKLWEHTKRTVLTAVKENERIGLDPSKVFLSALLHDVAKEIVFRKVGEASDRTTFRAADGMSEAEPKQIEYSKKTDIIEYYARDLSEESKKKLAKYSKKLAIIEYSAPSDAVGSAVLHQFLSAEIAQQVLGIEDSEILDAIRFHTTAKPDMSELGMLIYLADKIEPERDYEGVALIRAAIREDLYRAYNVCLERGYKHLLSRSASIYPLTNDAYLSNR